MNHLKTKHPEYTEKFEQKKAEVKELRAERRGMSLPCSLTTSTEEERKDLRQQNV